MEVKSTDTIFYRPEWTCGRYNRKSNAAIFYNLLEGLSFFYEDYSAEVIGCILSVDRNSSFSLDWLSMNVDISPNSLRPFLNKLLEYGLLTKTLPSQEYVLSYRARVQAVRQQQVLDAVAELHDMTVVGNSDAERSYMDKVGGITSVMLELTYRCSEKCIHCYNAGATRNDDEVNLRGHRRELNIEDYKRIIDELVSQGLIKICLTGGDPFSKSIIWDIIEYISEKGLAFDIFTNGIKAIDAVEKLANYYPRTVGISLYSNVAEVHDSITRVKGSHDKTIEFIKRCSDYALPMLIKCCIMKPNVKSYYTVKDVAYKYGCLPQFDLNITDSVEGDKCASTLLRLGHDELEIVLRDKDLIYYIGEDSTDAVIRNNNDFMCNAGINTFCITPEGNVQPCCAFPLKLGNVKDKNFSEIISDNKILKWWTSKRIKDCVDCNKHNYCSYCQMCVGNNYIAHGNPLKASENNCFLAKERFHLSQRMQKGDDPLHGSNLIDALDNLKIELSELKSIPSVNYRNDAGINGMS